MKIRHYLPYAAKKRHLRAYWLGVGDGWQQPDELSSSANVEYLARTDAEKWELQESLDAGANLGQSLRSLTMRGPL